MTTTPTHFVKTREIDRPGRAWLFLAPDGTTTRKRVRAARMPESSAVALAADINDGNPGEWEAKAVPVAATDTTAD